MEANLADKRYYEGIWVPKTQPVWANTKPDIKLDPKKTALFIIDMQNGFCLPDSPFVQRIRQSAPENYKYFLERSKIVISNLQRLQSFFRRNNLEVIQCVIASLTDDGRDRLPGHKAVGLHFPPGSKGAQVIDELKPRPGEIVFSKTTASMFATSNAYHVLRSMGIEHLVFGGGSTYGCVESTVRAAADLFGYTNVVVEDGCVSSDEERHVASIKAMALAFAVIASTDSVINHLTLQLEKSGARVK